MSGYLLVNSSVYFLNKLIEFKYKFELNESLRINFSNSLNLIFLKTWSSPFDNIVFKLLTLSMVFPYIIECAPQELFPIKEAVLLEEKVN